jgi:hypothetical protein
MLPRAPLAVFALAALGSACSGPAVPSVAAGNGDSAQASGHKRTFVYTGKEARFVVPSGVTKLTVVADGAEGGGNTHGYYSEPPGYGGEVSAVVPVQPGEKLYVFVGGEGGDSHDGYNGGGHGGSSKYALAFYGGGASDVREGGDALGDRILVAGGGGGAGGGYYFSGKGGAGGGSIGGSGGASRGQSSSGHDGGDGGSGGTRTNGGAGGAGGGSGEHGGQPGANGSRGNGGDGGASGSNGKGYDGGEGGGGGGGGYFGGGGGGGGEPYGSCSCDGGPGGGGGGGSSYVESKAHRTSNKQGVWTADGLVTVTW